VTRPAVFLFSGQGSQYPGMGRWLYENNRTYREVLDGLDAVAVAESGESVRGQLHADRPPGTVLADFRYTQPGLFMVQYAAAQMVLELGFVPEIVVGASLGEIVAAVVAGVASPPEVLRLLLRQAGLFERVCPPGGMLAVLAGPDFYARTPWLGEAHLAAVNSSGNIVLAGRPGVLDDIEQRLAGTDVLSQRLAVPYAFHSELIDPARDEFRRLVGELRLSPPRVPLVSAATAAPVRVLDADHLWRVLRDPIELDRTLAAVTAGGHRRWLDLGPAGTMANLVQGHWPPGHRNQALPVMSPFVRDEVLWRSLVEVAPADSAETGPGPLKPTSRRPTPVPRSSVLEVHLFPGQGSQTKGMGRDLFPRFPELTRQAGEILGYDIQEQCVRDPDRRLRRTEVTQPALYVVEALGHLAALEEGIRVPDFLLGHSLGEYVALYAGGAFDFATGLRLVQERGRLMSEATGGGMLAVSGLDPAAVRGVLDENGLPELDIANINAPAQVVLAGPADALERARTVLTPAGARCAPLNVSAPFHSRYMSAAADQFRSFAEGFTLIAPRIPVIANVDAQPYGDDVADRLCRQIAAPVRWTDSVRYLLARGRPVVREIGPGTVLTKLFTRLQDEPAEAADPPSAEPVPVKAEPGRGPQTSFTAAHGVRLPYVAGGLHRGISSVELVTRMARAGLASFYGTCGLPLGEVEAGLRTLAGTVGGGPYGVNLTFDPGAPQDEGRLIDLLMANGVRWVEASTYVRPTRDLIRYRLAGARSVDGRGVARNRLLAKVTRADVAVSFLQPAPADLVAGLLAEGVLDAAEAAAAARLPMADDVCVVGDCGGYTDLGVLAVLLPEVCRIRDELYPHGPAPRIGAAGGIGTPAAAASALLLGAEFVLTGSLNLGTAESGLSPVLKDRLQQIDLHATGYAPDGPLFELGGRAQVLRHGTLYHARAARLYELWRTHEEWEQIARPVRDKIEQEFFRCTFAEMEAAADRAGQRSADPRRRMGRVFRQYCDEAARFAIEGVPGRELDYHLDCGPALAAANAWLRGTSQEKWPDRHVDEIAQAVMAGARDLLQRPAPAAVPVRAAI